MLCVMSVSDPVGLLGNWLLVVLLRFSVKAF